VICGVLSGTVLAMLVEGLFTLFARLLRPMDVRRTKARY
jgi:hypothetical protein